MLNFLYLEFTKTLIGMYIFLYEILRLGLKCSYFCSAEKKRIFTLSVCEVVINLSGDNKVSSDDDRFCLNYDFLFLKASISDHPLKISKVSVSVLN